MACKLRCLFHTFLLCFLVFFLLMFIVGFQFLSEDDMDMTDNWDYVNRIETDHHGSIEPEALHRATQESIPYPVILWWTPFTGEPGMVKTCGQVKCFFTVDRHYKDHVNTTVFMFYGTDFNYGDLPLPRKPNHQWGLFHEESPKNIYLLSHKDALILFNHTATFRRESDHPLTTQYLHNLSSLEDTKYLKSVQEKTMHLGDLALVNYVQSDCGTPSDRDHFVEMLQRHIKVDSYGLCRHNKDLPHDLRDPLKGMESNKFYELLSRYKFTLAMENGVCNDYITEKFWRPFLVGSVPIVFGSPRAKDFTPDSHSAIFVEDFSSMEELVALLLHLNHSDSEYEQYLQYKYRGVTNNYLRQVMESRKWGINDWRKPNFVDTFECQVCQRVHENLARGRRGEAPLRYQANVEHYGCPEPRVFSDSPPGNLERVVDVYWSQHWRNTQFLATALRQLVEHGEVFDMQDVHTLASKVKYSQNNS